MYIIKTFLALVCTVVIIGCEDKPITKTAYCEQAAYNHCASIGFRTNRLCFLVFAKDCSTEDKEAAHKECLRIVRSSASSDECVLRWP